MKKKMMMRAYAPVVLANTFIGGVAATIGDATLLAAKLGISVNEISNFQVVGSDIQCGISGNYALPINAFNSNTSITYYNDVGLKVNSLGNSVFFNCINLTSANIPNVTAIGSRAFYGCVNLTSDLIFNNLATMTGDLNFWRCKIKSFIAPLLNSVTPSCFFDCKELGNVDIRTANLIGENAFSGNSKLLTINTLSVNSIGISAFNGCFLLATLSTTLLSRLEDSTFNGCSSLNNINIQSVNWMGSNVFFNCINLTSANIPNVTAIGSRAFYGCVNLTSDLILNNLATMTGDLNFWRCKIKSFIAPLLNSVPNRCFGSCGEITAIDIRTAHFIGANNTIDEGVFFGVKIGCTITAKLTMQTINAGAVEPDLLFARDSRAATIIYV